MVSARLVRNEDELHEFYKWLLSRAQEEEHNGNDNYARIYQEYAETVKQALNC
jgi:hypothetical protein